MAKKMTIEDLAVMVKRGFDDTASKRDVKLVDDRLDKVDDRLQKIEKEVKELREDLAFVTRLPASVERRVDRMEDDIRLIKTKVGLR